MSTQTTGLLSGTPKGPGLLQLALPPSCIEYCPAHPEYFIVGTYNLQEDGEDYAGTGNIPAAGQETQKPVEVEEQPDDDDQEDMPAKREQSRNGSLILFRHKGDQV